MEFEIVCPQPLLIEEEKYKITYKSYIDNEQPRTTAQQITNAEVNKADNKLPFI